MTQWLEEQARVRERRGLVRSPLVRVANDRMVDLASNDYLGLATDARLAEAAREAIAKWGTGATSSRLVAGTTELHVELEHELAQLTGMDAALVFSSGYLANLGVTTALGGPGTLIVADEQCHASLIDGFRLSRSEVRNFRHNSVQDAADKLANRTQPRALIAVESIYSVGGDVAPLSELLALAEGHDAMLLVDEAHSLGVSGSGSNTGWGADRRNQVGRPSQRHRHRHSFQGTRQPRRGCPWLTCCSGSTWSTGPGASSSTPRWLPLRQLPRSRPLASSRPSRGVPRLSITMQPHWLPDCKLRREGPVPPSNIPSEQSSPFPCHPPRLPLQQPEPHMRRVSVWVASVHRPFRMGCRAFVSLRAPPSHRRTSSKPAQRCAASWREHP